MTRIFVSHATPDRPAAVEVVELLESHGLDTWYCADDIQATADWERTIRDALKECDWFVVLLSEAAVESRWVRAEVHWAMDNRVDRVVPVLLEACDPGSVHLMMPTVQHIDFTEDPVKARDDLLAVWKLSYATGPDRFRHIRSLGSGGMGKVSLAFDERLEREVAIKRMRRTVAEKDSMRRRFLQEARDSAALSHPNIVSILSIEGDDDGPFLVLEYLDAGTLQDRLRAGKMDLKESLSVLRQLLEALVHAHGKKVIHRDIKPQNVLLTGGGVPKLTDFGLAWVVGQDDRFEGDVREGTAHYLAPELEDRNEEPNPRTDLYSLGLTFYQMLTGRTARRVRESEVPDLVRPFLRKLIDENPNLRYSTAAEALEECLGIERSLELASRTEEETRTRMAQTVEVALEHCANGRFVDAEAALVRVTSEDPHHFGALTGLMVVGLARGEMARASELYGTLLDLEGEHPVFSEVRAFLADVGTPTRLVVTPEPMPFSYRADDLEASRFTKDLVRHSRETVNLGDIGELLVGLARDKGLEGSFRYSSRGRESHCLRFELPGVEVRANYDYALTPRKLLRPRKLEGILLSLEVEGEPFPAFRVIRYLMNNLESRYKRPVSRFVTPGIAGLGADVAEQQVRAWQRFNLDLADLVRGRLVSVEEES